MIYGHDKTIHGNTSLDIEVDEETGEVVSVWFRCMMIPFEVTKTRKNRADEMRGAFKDYKAQLLAVEIEDESLPH